MEDRSCWSFDRNIAEAVSTAKKVQPDHMVGIMNLKNQSNKHNRGHLVADAARRHEWILPGNGLMLHKYQSTNCTHGETAVRLH